MLNRIKPRITYANVTATLALFVALGGGSYAALKLPRNSVGSKQIRTNAVGTRAVADRSIRLRDISVAARTSLKGQAGPAGPAGAAGPPGASATRFFAAVTSAGGFVRGNATSGGRETDIGTYTVGFAQPVTACAFTATLGTTDTATTAPGRITLREVAGKVAVQTYDASGAPADLPFHVIVAC